MLSITTDNGDKGKHIFKNSLHNDVGERDDSYGDNDGVYGNDGYYSANNNSIDGKEGGNNGEETAMKILPNEIARERTCSFFN